MAARNGRALTREDLNDSINNLGTQVDLKLDRVLDKVAVLHSTLVGHIAQEEKTTTAMLLDIEGLKKYRWTLVGAVAAVIFLAKFLGHALFGW